MTIPRRSQRNYAQGGTNLSGGGAVHLGEGAGGSGPKSGACTSFFSHQDVLYGSIKHFVSLMLLLIQPQKDAPFFPTETMLFRKITHVKVLIEHNLKKVYI